ncbi:MAG TPA: S-adenosylmethionine decarboxylase [Flavipsychrobacter sp.]|nr:S-adenosylmethionine decarboxylase [Flavipsychrobacter sp.]
MDTYQPGLHIIATFLASAKDLKRIHECKDFFDQMIRALELTNVGEVYHPFPGGGFTASVCLTESHVSIHTWPEYGLATFDVFLSSYREDNSKKAARFYEQTIRFFNATEKSRVDLQR